MYVVERVPTSWFHAQTTCGSRSSRSLGYATRLTKTEYGGSDVFLLIHHNTAIVQYHDDGSISTTMGGYYSPTTKARLNAALRNSPWGIGCDRGQWYWYRNGERFCEYEDGDRVYLAPGVLGKDGIY